MMTMTKMLRNYNLLGISMSFDKENDTVLSKVIFLNISSAFYFHYNKHHDCFDIYNSTSYVYTHFFDVDIVILIKVAFFYQTRF